MLKDKDIGLLQPLDSLFTSVGRGIVLLKDVGRLIAFKLVKIITLYYDLVIVQNQEGFKDFIYISKIINPSSRRSLFELVILLKHLS